MNPMLTRGLWIPDPNFRHGTGDGTAWTEGSSMGTKVDRIPHSYGTGASLRIALDGMTFSNAYSLHSGYTPLGVAASPYLSGSSSIEFLAMAMVKTGNVSAGNTNWLMYGYLNGYTDTGSGTESAGAAFKDTSGDYFTYSSDWMLVVCALTMPINSTTDWYKLRLQFRDESAAGSNDYLHIAWVGVAAPYDAATPGDYLTSYYGPDCNLGMQANPSGVGGLVRNYSMPWPTVDSDDKFVIDECIAWNSKTPTGGVSSTGDGTTQNLSNNGAAQPIIIAIDRDDYKTAFYASLSPVSFAPNALGYWPASDAKHATTLVFTEQDRPRV